MTSNDISNFLTSISEAKRAYEAEPDYQRRINDLELDKRRLGDTVAQRELRIHELKTEASQLTAALRSVEAERDDAGFRIVAETDKVQALLRLVQQFVGTALETIGAVEGNKLQIVKENDIAEVMRTNTGQAHRIEELEVRLLDSEAEVNRLNSDLRMDRKLQSPFVTTDRTEDISSSGGAITGRWYAEDKLELPRSVDTTPASEGQREVDPTPALTPNSVDGQTAGLNASDAESGSTEGQSDGPFAKVDTTPITQSETVSSQSAQVLEDAASNASQPERNRDRTTFFKGRKYWDVTYFVPLHQWLNEGGTREDYYWKPQDDFDLPQANRASHQS